MTQSVNLIGKFIILYYDEDIKKVGIKFIRNKGDYTMEIKSSNNSSYVACSKFFSFFKINKPMVGRTYKQLVLPEQIEFGGPLIVLNYPNKE